MRLIDADALMQEMRIGRKAAALLVQDAPTVEAEPTKPGKWEKPPNLGLNGFVRCSECKDVYIDKEWLTDGKWNFCPNCGAEMEKEVPAEETTVIKFANGEAVYCSGCGYLKAYREAVYCDYPQAPRLLCPYHFENDDRIYCPNWHPYETGGPNG